MSHNDKSDKLLRSAIQFTDMPYIEGKKIADVLYRASVTTMGGYLRFRIMKMEGVVSLSCYNETLTLCLRDGVSPKIFESKIIELSEQVGVIINKINYKRGTGYCPVCKKTFTDNAVECLGKEGKDHHVISQIKEAKQPYIFSVTDFYLV